MSCRHHDSLTIVEKVRQAYHAILGTDDRYDDPVLDDAAHLLGDVLDDLASPYCCEDGCRQQRMSSFPWCPWHRPERFGPLPDGFPPYPQESPAS